MSKYIINVDWLTIYGQSTLLSPNQRYHFIKRQKGGQQFKDVYDVYDIEENEKYAIVQARPYSPIIPKHAVMVQVVNRYLYRQNWNITVNNFMFSCNITPISISRIDICADFNTFKNGLHPKTLINGLVTGKYRHVGRSKVTIEGLLKDGLDAQYMRIGNRESEISVYLYNKSLELREVKDKPYIREMWKNSGLDVTRDVWRLEVSLLNCQMRTVIKQTGEMIRLDLDFFKTQGIVENVYRCAVMKALDIRVPNGETRTNRMQKLEYFGELTSSLLMTVPTNDSCTTRMDRILLKRLANAHQQYRVDDADSMEKIQGAIEVMIQNEALREYYYERIIPNIGYYKDS